MVVSYLFPVTMKKLLFLTVFLFLSYQITQAQSALNALNFDGNNDYVSATVPTVLTNISNNDFTIETWIKPTGNSFSRVLFSQVNASNFVSLSLSASNEIYFYINNSHSEKSNISLPLGTWSHIACTWDASATEINIYINGILQSTSPGGSSSTGSNNVMTIGARTNAAQFFSGDLDEFRIWNLKRTNCEIFSAMNSEFTVLPLNLVAYYNFNQGTPSGVNTGINTLPDVTTNYNGTLNNFGLTGSTSNWVTSGATINSTGNNSVQGVDTRTECNSLTWIDGNTYTSSNNTATHTISGGAANGCDSTVTLDLTIVNSAVGTDTRTECNSFTWIDGNTYTSSNNSATYTISGGAANGCDSTVTLDLTIVNSAVGTDTRTECNSFTWIDGNTYTSSNNSATHTISGGAANGCDSTVTLDLTIVNSAVGTDTRTECNSFTWIDGNTYTSSNNSATYTISGGAANGCDSTVTLDLTIVNSAVGTDTRTECNSFTWIDGNTYTSSNNTATHTISGGAANGCDSTVTLDLTIVNSTVGTDTRTECNSFTWIDGNTYTSSNNSATHTISGGAANGCDSTVTLDLTINSVSSLSITVVNDSIIANNSSATYQWLDCDMNYAVIDFQTFQTFQPSMNGNYAVELTENGCVDTSACINFNVLGIYDTPNNHNFMVYPNPSNGDYTIDLGESKKAVYFEIVDITGRVIESVQQTNIQRFDFQIQQPAGIYFIRVNTSNKQAVLRLIKQ